MKAASRFELHDFYTNPCLPSLIRGPPGHQTLSDYQPEVGEDAVSSMDPAPPAVVPSLSPEEQEALQGELAKVGSPRWGGVRVSSGRGQGSVVVGVRSSRGQEW